MLRRKLWPELTEMSMNLTMAALLSIGALLSIRLQEPPTVSPEEVSRKMEAGRRTVVLDVRTPGEFAGETGHLKGAILIPVQELDARLQELKPFEKDTLIVYCRTDNRSRSAVSILESNGYAAVRMSGGITAWRALGLPVVVEEPK
jgi:rhodanese-related sulfurtransferase